MQTLKISVIFLCIAITALITNCFLWGEVDWQEHSTDHFIIYYHKEIPQDYIKEVAAKAEEYYQSIAENLGFNLYEFWLWDNRAKIYIFKDAKEYRQEKPLKPYWSGGNVSVRRKIIKTYPWAEGFFDRLLPHELGHIMFREFVGFRNNVPLWLDEGVATLQEKADIKNNSIMMKKLLRKTIPIPISKLTRITQETLIVPEVFYPQSASIVDYLLSQFGKERFVKFCKYLKDGSLFEKAIASVYNFNDLIQLEKAWIEYLKNLKENN